MAAAISSLPTTSHAVNRFLSPSTSYPSLFCRPLSAASIPCKPLLFTHAPTLFSFLHSNFSRSFCTSSVSSPPNDVSHSLSLDEDIELDSEGEEAEDDYGYIDGETGSDGEDMDKLELKDNAVSVSVSDESPKQGWKGDGIEVPKLTVKEQKELASYAHGLGKKLKSELVGKSGVTDNVATSFIETLEANELLKIKIHRTCPVELEDAVQRLEEATGSVVVSKIGRTVKAEEKRITKAEFMPEKIQNLTLAPW